MSSSDSKFFYHIDNFCNNLDDEIFERILVAFGIGKHNLR